MNKVLLIGLAVVVLGAAGYGVLTNTRAGQDFLLEQALQAQAGSDFKPQRLQGLRSNGVRQFLAVTGSKPRSGLYHGACWQSDVFGGFGIWSEYSFTSQWAPYRLLRGLLLTHFPRIISLALVI